jgi:asparagine synthetase B (glutamine-hydrolysing)
VVGRWSLPSIRMDAAAPSRKQIEAEVARYRDVPAFPNGSCLDPLRARAAAEVDVVLTGYGGDDWFTGSPLRATDLLVEGRVVNAARQWWADGTRCGGGAARAALLRHVLAPLVPSALKPIARALAGVRSPAFDWIRPEFARRTGLRDRVRRRRRPFPTYVQREIDAVTSCALQVIGDELEDRAAAAAGLDQRHPFNDRRVAEFGFALPQAQRTDERETKIVIRRALAADLPESVRCRADKAEFSSTFVETLERLGGRAFFNELRSARAGWVDADAARSHCDRVLDLYRRGNAAYIRSTGPVWAVAAVELWLRHIEGVTS